MHLLHRFGAVAASAGPCLAFFLAAFSLGPAPPVAPDSPDPQAALPSSLQAPRPPSFPAARIGLKAVFGRAGNDHGGSPDRIKALVGDLAALGVDLTRVEARWTLVEPRRGTYDFSEYDRLTQALAEAGIEPLFMIYCAPVWAMRGRPEYESLFARRGMANLFTVVWPADTYLPDFQEFCSALAGRYRGITRLFEFWCEPDGMAGPIVLTDRDRKPADIVFGGDPVLYVRWLRACYEGLKRGNPEALLAAGSLSLPDLDFLRALYALEFQSWCDAVSLHPYAESGFNAGGVRQVRRLMVSNGDCARPIWLTEFGWRVGGSKEDEYRHGAAIKASFASLADLPFVTQAHFFTLNDWLTDEGDPRSAERFGLEDEGGERRPAFAIFREEKLRFDREARPQPPDHSSLWFAALPGSFDPAGFARFTIDAWTGSPGVFELGGDLKFADPAPRLPKGRTFLPVIARLDRPEPVTILYRVSLGPWESEVMLRPVRRCPMRPDGPVQGDVSEPGPASPAMFLAWSRTHLFTRVNAWDPEHRQPHRGNDLWQGDSLLVALDPQALSPPGARYLADDQEYLIALAAEGPGLWRSYAREPSWVGSLGPGEARFGVSRSGPVTRYELDLPWSQFMLGAPPPGSSIGMAVALFDLSAAGRSKQVLFGGGILGKKEPAAFGTIILEP